MGLARALVAVCAFALALPVWVASPATSVRAATIIVTSTADAVMMGDGCTLREAIQAANTDAAVNECAAGAGADVIDASGISGTITLGSALPDIASDMTVRGSISDNLTIYGNSMPVFGQFLVVNAAVTATLSHIRIESYIGRRSGYCSTFVTNRGTLAVLNSNFGCTDYISGALSGLGNYGTLTVTNSFIGDIANHSRGTIMVTNYGGRSVSNGDTYTGNGDGGMVTVADSNVGYIVNGGNGTIVVMNSTFGSVDNSSDAGRVTVTNSTGRTLTNYSDGTLTAMNTTISGSSDGIGNLGTMRITNSTISDTSAYAAAAIINNRGTITLTNSTVGGNKTDAIRNSDGGRMTITSSTISGNDGVGIRDDGGGPLLLAHSIVAGNLRAVIGDGVRSTTAAFTETGPNFLSGDPRLGPLRDNGGPTKTMLPAPGSPVIDAGGVCPVATDQRGIPRPQGAACDIGAVEVGVVASAPQPRATTAPMIAPPALVPPTRGAGPQVATPAPMPAPRGVESTATIAPTNTPTRMPTSTPTSTIPSLYGTPNPLPPRR